MRGLFSRARVRESNRYLPSACRDTRFESARDAPVSGSRNYGLNSLVFASVHEWYIVNVAGIASVISRGRSIDRFADKLARRLTNHPLIFIRESTDVMESGSSRQIRSKSGEFFPPSSNVRHRERGRAIVITREDRGIRLIASRAGAIGILLHERGEGRTERKSRGCR